MAEKQTQANKTLTIALLVRSILHLVVVISVTCWGFLRWNLPLPGIAVGVGGLVLTVLVWALFLSPRAVLSTDRYARALIELLFIAGGTAALLDMHVFWVIPTAFGVLGAILGYLASLQQK